ncbi:hypothetical protein [Edwardsiella anguillarum]|uniref:hypothetical protein n=1 Tax=Edwardsiella anguillarum TaxID=1821960 RepID=UPI001ED98993|nr:hypothetical protein [Edwardsiella anguillarum]UOU78055.1 hypothetical protein MUN71_13405 [Edwardsiella anguillarum]WHQ15114.1 hypothetical protein MQ083_04930 [Edwardsiella anguillarum]WHQ16725.1 hypothetical protein MQ085_12450 [Edwardsiella anguillarum]WHQ20260.1 hypothetical protein MQ089_12450 [Edwardsiella anguillarum]WHQ23782.1 hypothetical protein MQ094_12460 [Edwardsiella anguillarum]
MSYSDTRGEGDDEQGSAPFLATFAGQRSRVISRRTGAESAYRRRGCANLTLRADLRKDRHSANGGASATVLGGFGGLVSRYRLAKIARVMPEIEAGYPGTMSARQQVTLESGYRDTGFGSGELRAG